MAGCRIIGGNRVPVLLHTTLQHEQYDLLYQRGISKGDHL